MELAILVWLISMLSGMKVFLGFTAFLFILFVPIYLINRAEDGEPIRYRWPILYSSIAVLAILSNIALPSEKTAYIMVGAYATQQIAQDPKVQQIGAKTLLLIQQKLDEYIKQEPKK